MVQFVFFFNDTAATEIYTLSLHDALPIWRAPAADGGGDPGRVRGAVPGRGAGGARADRGRRLRRQLGALLGAGRRRRGVCGLVLRPRLARRALAVRPLRRARAARVVLALPVRAGRRDRGARRAG